MQPLWDIVQESFREAEFLFGRWEAGLDSNELTLDDVATGVEERLLGALDGICIGGGRAVEALLVPAVQRKHPRFATVSTLALASQGRAGADALGRALAVTPHDRLGAVRRGLELAPDDRALWRLSGQLVDLEPDAQACVVEAMAYRRFEPPATVARSLARSAPAVQRAWIRLAASSAAPWARRDLEWGLAHVDPALRCDAAAAGLVLGLDGAAAAARELVAGMVVDHDALLVPLAVLGGRAMLPHLQARLSRPTPGRAVFDALETVGTIEAVDLCVDYGRRHTSCARADDAVRALTGSEPSGWPSIRVEWKPRTRYWAGRPFDATPHLPVALSTATTRERHRLCVELAIATAGRARVTATTWTAVQRNQLAAAAAVEAA